MSDANNASAGANSGAASSAAPKKPPAYAPFFRMIGSTLLLEFKIQFANMKKECQISGFAYRLEIGLFSSRL